MVLSLSLGVGLNGTVFGFVYAALLRPAPYVEPSALVSVQSALQVTDEDLLTFNEYREIRASATTLRSIAAYRMGAGFRYSMTTDDKSLRGAGILVSGSLFDVLQIRPMIGRSIQVEDEQPAAPDVVLLSDHFWARAFGSDRHVIGEAISIRGQPYTVIGVMPPQFWFPTWDVDFWMPLKLPPNLLADRSLSLIGRITVGSNRAQSAAEFLAIGARLDAASGREDRRWWRIQDLRQVDRPGDIQLLVILQLVAGAVLLLACVNVSNLMLVRGSARHAETIVRTALGGSFWAVARPVLAEGVLLSGLTTIVGGAAAALGIRMTVAAMDRGGLVAWVLSGQTHVFAFAALGALLATSLCTALPLFDLTRRRRTLRSLAFAPRTRQTRHGAQAAVTLQVALSLSLLTCALLLVNSYREDAKWSPGFRAEGLIEVSTAPSQDGQPHLGATAIAGAIQAVPGIYAMSQMEPVLAPGGLTSDVATAVADCTCRQVTGTFITTMQIPVIRGRDFSRLDVQSHAAVALVTATLATRLWGLENAVGHRVRIARGNEWLTVIGVVDDVQFSRPDNTSRLRAVPAAAFFLSEPDSMVQPTIFIRTTPGSSPAVFFAAMRAAGVPNSVKKALSSAESVSMLLNREMEDRQTYALEFAALASLALVLTLIGLNAVLSYQVAMRKYELAIRAALGGSPRQLFSSVAASGFLLLLPGGIIGACLGYGCAKLLSSIIVEQGRSVFPPLMLGILTLSVAGAAAIIPAAVRAGRVFPGGILRE